MISSLDLIGVIPDKSSILPVSALRKRVPSHPGEPVTRYFIFFFRKNCLFKYYRSCAKKKIPVTTRNKPKN